MRHRLARPALATVACLLAGSACAQNYPEKTIRIVVPFPPGGNIDITGRSIAPGLSELLGVPVVVDNRGGAAGTIGVDLVAKAPPDGYTLVVGSTGTITAAASLYPKLPYNPLKDLAPVSMVTDAPIILLCHPALRAKNVRELLGLAKAKPGVMTYGSAGSGSTNHLAGELFQGRTGVKITHIPYKGSGPALIDLMGGQIDLYFDQLTSSIGFIKSGKLRALAIAQPARSRLLPDLATMSEQGCTGCEASTFAGILAPAAVPRPILDRLNAAVVKVVNSDTVRDRFINLGAEPRPTTQEQFAQIIRDDFARWQKVVRDSNIKLEL
jgi:tripartite-type tricarboxylate transporter receptor subunit TctC